MNELIGSKWGLCRNMKMVPMRIDMDDVIPSWIGRIVIMMEVITVMEVEWILRILLRQIIDDGYCVVPISKRGGKKWEVIMDDDGRMNDEWCVCRSGTGVLEDAACMRRVTKQEQQLFGWNVVYKKPHV